jgi:hypothetical protein
MCTKRKYRDKISAMFALSQCRRYTKVTEKIESRCYYCSKCNAWHLTSKR